MDRNVKKTSYPLPAGVMAAMLAVSVTGHTGPAVQDHAAIQRTAVAFVTTRAGGFAVPPEVAAGRLDPRLRLPRCEVPLQGFESPGGLKPGRSVVGVRCTGKRAWKLYVPVQIKLPAEVVILKKPLRRGDMITAEDLGMRREDLSELRGQYYRDLSDLVGQRVKRHLAANVVITPAMVDAGRLVQRGSRVTIVSDNGPVEVRMAGKALAHGGRGDQIRVKNQASGRTITATVVDRGLVRAAP